MSSALSIRVRGIVQGVGFRPFIYRLACEHGLAGWVLNGEDGVAIHAEGAEQALQAFLAAIRLEAPPAAVIADIEVRPAHPSGLTGFTIRESERRDKPTVRISPDLPVCERCLKELADVADPRYQYPYINCTNCGPRYTVIESLPYDRPNTTMKSWPMDRYCDAQYHNPSDRRFHAQPIACPRCGPHYFLKNTDHTGPDDEHAVQRSSELLREGRIIAVKGLGGYHLACDARNAAAVSALRERKYRKEKPFAVMVRDVEVARGIIDLSPDAERLLTSIARPIVLAPTAAKLPGVAPDNDELGVMLPYTPLQHMLFAAGAPEVLVMTSANRSSEPIAYAEEDAFDRLAGVADAFLVGERPIARRVDDSVARAGVFGPVILRRSRGYSPGAVATLPLDRPLLAVGADLKNSVTLVVDGQAFVSQHIGDLDHYQAFQAFQETIRDLVSMYEVSWGDLLVVHDAHPQYLSTNHALGLTGGQKFAVQHHRAHIASVLAERSEWDKNVLGVSFDGTGYGDDGSIWGGEFFAGSVRDGFRRIAHLRPAKLAGGDAAAHHPVQAAAGFLAQIEAMPDPNKEPFNFPARYTQALELVRKDVRSFTTTSVGRLFDSAAALLGFTRAITFEGQAAMWVEALARKSGSSESFPFPFENGELDFRPLLLAVAEERKRGAEPRDVARAFQRGVACGLADAIRQLCSDLGLDTVVFSGGVFQNELLLRDIKSGLQSDQLKIWTNRSVPPNDGGISLGQAALGAFATHG
ncbi:MAG TPA: carbamoyltransferase HypF [Terriglobales bacterium]|jgi:hydrogenase maturation protein HypF|nr:carbamoyltransferase HypF [Terriglobales bacterium]